MSLIDVAKGSDDGTVNSDYEVVASKTSHRASREAGLVRHHRQHSRSSARPVAQTSLHWRGTGVCRRSLRIG